jgi:SNF2 family DNA or RNA helicase
MFFILYVKFFQQCIHRIHRFGQNAAIVRVRKFVVNDSVEERIVELQKRKAFVANEVYSDEAGGTGKLEGSRLSLDDFRLIFQRK